uniref:Uncharacterized protein n=1 Tax=Oryza nivara TaxID=4536 RepID=A0A0E0HZ94_ORYNI
MNTQVEHKNTHERSSQAIAESLAAGPTPSLPPPPVAAAPTSPHVGPPLPARSGGGEVLLPPPLSGRRLPSSHHPPPPPPPPLLPGCRSRPDLADRRRRCRLRCLAAAFPPATTADARER